MRRRSFLSGSTAAVLGRDPQNVMKSGTVKATGKTKVVYDLLGMMTKFEFWFPIVTRPA